MKTKHFLIISLLILLTRSIWATVPQPATRKPSLPNFLEPMNFKTVEMKLFQSDVSGMVTDIYGDLSWNPAFLSQVRKRMIYLDFNFYATQTTAVTAPEFRSDIYLVYPSWYSTTSVSGVQLEPLYNFALLMPVNRNLTIGIVNRSIFDYGPFRYTYSYDYRAVNEAAYADWSAIPDDLDPQRLEVDDNQQIVYGTQTEFSASYKLTSNLDMGMRLGMMNFHRDGDLYNSKWGYYPHSSFADLNDENLLITGKDYTIGMGLLYRPNHRTSLGIYGEIIDGNADEETASVDTSYSWSERDSDSDYYSFYDYDLESDQNYNMLGTRPSLTLSFERKLTEKFILRSFFKLSNSNTDIDFMTSSEDTTWRDRTYDKYSGGSYYFQRMISHDAGRQHFSGDGNEKTSYWKWFASLIYRTDNNWSLFGGIQINRYNSEKAYNETSDYYSATDYEYLEYDPGTLEYLNTHIKLYEYTHNYKKYTAVIPVGIKARVIKEFYVILGSELRYYFVDEDEKGRLLYPEKIAKRWENGTLVVNDIETDRYEEYRSKPAKEFSRATYVNLAIAYQHPSGINLFIRSNGNIMETYGWDIGFEYQW